MSRMRDSVHHDERGFITGILMKTLIFLALLGFAGYEAAQVIVATAASGSAAQAGADAAADTFHATNNVNQARAEARRAVHEKNPDARMTDFTVSDKGVASVTVELTAKTILVKRLSFLKDFGVVDSTATASRSD